MPSRATLVSIHRERDVTTTVVDCAEPPSAAIAPASLVDDSTDWVAVIELHHLIGKAGSRLSFETYGPVEHEPVVGREYTLQSWWSQGALDLVTDMNRVWTREAYPPGGDDCVYCPLTYSWFGRGESDDSVMEGYRSRDVWITVDAYERFIRDDLLRIRSRHG